MCVILGMNLAGKMLTSSSVRFSRPSVRIWSAEGALSLGVSASLRR
jgi:hypothetical protein